jgi:transposase
VDFRDVSEEELRALLERARPSLAPEDAELLEGLVGTVSMLWQLLQDKNLSIRRLRNLLFGPSTEKTDQVLGAPDEEGSQPDGGEEHDGDEENDGAETPDGPDGAKKKPRPRGHGRNGADRYQGAERVVVPHPELSSGGACPTCDHGKVYAAKPSRLIRVQGSPILCARVYELARWRCNLCGEVFTAALPEEAGPKKYDETAGSLVALLKYGAGLPFYRLEHLQASLGVPLPASTQWEIVEGAAQSARPAFEALIEEAAQGRVVYNDDTHMRILEPGGSATLPPPRDGPPSATPGERTGVFTTGIVSQTGDRTISLYFTGRRHAGERLAEVLAHRAADAKPPIQMCDGLSRNLPKEFETILSNCLAHGRRQFVDLAPSFPEACRTVLESLGKVYRNEAKAREQALSPEGRLAWHQAESGPVMEALHAWLQAQFADKLVEPNSGLGKAITYMLKRWEPLTLFLRQTGAPLDNNICERALKRAILHRKNALFYKTENGAWVGDLFMSLIHTCRLCNANPFDYLTELQKNATAVAERPGDWLPWNYRDTLASASDRPQPDRPA